MSVVAQFFYVGAQVSIWSYYINIAQELTGVDERTAARLLVASLFLFMVGRFAGTWLLGKISAKQLLVASSVISMALCGIAAVAPGYFGLVSLSLTSLFMSIMFPTIFATGVSSSASPPKSGIVADYHGDYWRSDHPANSWPGG